MRIVLTIVGKDKVGIIAKVSNILAEHGVNILNINQNIMEGFFNMVLIADMTGAAVKLQDLKDIFTALGRDQSTKRRNIYGDAPYLGGCLCSRLKISWKLTR